MNFTSSQILEISGALLVAFTAMVLSYRLPVRFLVAILFVTIPFQFIDTRYGSINVAIAFLFAFFLFVRGEIKLMPLKWSTIFLILCVLLSFTQVHPSHNLSQMVYLGGFFSCFAVFLIIYNFVVKEGNLLFVFRLLFLLNVLVVVYSALQIMAGGKNYVELFGGLKISIVPARGGGDSRLAGPFGSTKPGLFAEYLVISNLLIAYAVLFVKSGKEKLSLLLLALCNLGCLVATGNRGGLIGIVLFFCLFLFSMRSVLGVANTVKILVASVALFIVSAALIMNFTSYNRLFERLENTKVDGAVPDTRARAWPAAIAHFQESPLLGHGPRLRLQDDKIINYPDHKVIDFPHNLYLYLLCTVGIVGLSAYVIFWLSMLLNLGVGTGGRTGDDLLDHFPKLSVLLVIYILFDQIKIEYARYNSFDYAHFLFALFGLFLGMSERKRQLMGRSSINKFNWRQDLGVNN